MIIDLRDYTLKPGTRDRFVERCETVIFPEQERLGATILGTFRDAENPNGFVWLRAMPDMAERRRVLTAFYTNGEVWKANHREVNSWIVDSGNVLLVEPLSDVMAPATDTSMVVMYTCLSSEPPLDHEGLGEVARAINDVGGRLLVTLATEPSDNNYPRHPIRTGEFGFVVLATFDPKRHRPLGHPAVEERRLLPTKRSWLR